MTRTLNLVAEFAPAFDDGSTRSSSPTSTRGRGESHGVTGEVVAEAIVERAAPACATSTARDLDDVPDALEALRGASDVVAAARRRRRRRRSRLDCEGRA